MKKQKRFRMKLQQLVLLISLVVGSWMYFDTRDITLTALAFISSFVVLQLILYIFSEKRAFKRATIKDIDRMNGLKFERFLGYLYEKEGYTTQVTKSSGDFGADLVLKANGRKIVVQAKRYNRGVGITALKEVQKAKRYYKAKEAWVVTNNSFTKPAIEYANSANIRLVNREELLRLMKKHCR